jgi:signal transduction histidine kinase
MLSPAPTKNLPENLRYSPWTLLFLNKNTENQFHDNFYQSKKLILKFTTILAVFVYVAFGILDYYATPNHQTIWLIRSLSGFPMLTLGALIVFFGLFPKYQHLILALAIWITGCSVLVMIALGDEFVAINYFSGINVVILYGTMLFFVNYRHTIVIACSLGLMYGLLAFNLAMPQANLINSLYFIFSGIVLSIIAVYLQEDYARTNFIINRLLKDSVAEAESANKAKSDFLSVMSHELRSPLISVKGYAEMMEHEMMGPLSEKYRTYAGDIRTSAEHLVSIIGDVLDYTKITGGHWELNSEPILSTALVHESLTLIRGMAEQKKITLHSEVKDEVVLTLDTRLTRQMITNLISNALKFSDAGTAITIRLERDDHGGVCIAVTDQGKGIPEDDLERVLKPFEQIHDPKSRESGGTGLGLPFVVEVMQRHGGSMKLESTVGIGTTVMLHFPPERVTTA